VLEWWLWLDLDARALLQGVWMSYVVRGLLRCFWWKVEEKKENEV
jgi:hypothetical protein